MKEIDKDYLEGELIQLYKQAAALSETIVELAESEDQNEEQRRIRLTYLLDDLLHDATKKFEDYVDDLYSGDEEEGKALYDIRADRVLIMLMRRFGANVRARNFPSGVGVVPGSCERYAGGASEDFELLKQLFEVDGATYRNGVATANIHGVTYCLDIDDESQKVLGTYEDEKRKCDIGGVINEDHA